MKIFTLGCYAVLFALCVTWTSGCYAHMSGQGAGVEVVVHDSRWHYDHDHDDNWRSNHPWYNDHRYDGQ